MTRATRAWVASTEAYPCSPTTSDRVTWLTRCGVSSRRAQAKGAGASNRRQSSWGSSVCIARHTPRETRGERVLMLRQCKKSTCLCKPAPCWRLLVPAHWLDVSKSLPRTLPGSVSAADTQAQRLSMSRSGRLYRYCGNIHIILHQTASTASVTRCAARTGGAVAVCDMRRVLGLQSNFLGHEFGLETIDVLWFVRSVALFVLLGVCLSHFKPPQPCVRSCCSRIGIVPVAQMRRASPNSARFVLPSRRAAVCFPPQIPRPCSPGRVGGEARGL